MMACYYVRSAEWIPIFNLDDNPHFFDMRMGRRGDVEHVGHGGLQCNNECGGKTARWSRHLVLPTERRP